MVWGVGVGGVPSGCQALGLPSLQHFNPWGLYSSQVTPAVSLHLEMRLPNIIEEVAGEKKREFTIEVLGAAAGASHQEQNPLLQAGQTN